MRRETRRTARAGMPVGLKKDGSASGTIAERGERERERKGGRIRVEYVTKRGSERNTGGPR